MPALHLASGEYVVVPPDAAPDDLLAFTTEHHAAGGGLRVQFEERLPEVLLTAIGDAVASFGEIEVYAHDRADPDLSWTRFLPVVRRLSLSTARTDSFEPLSALVELRSLSLPTTLGTRASLAALAPLTRLEELGVGAHDRGFEVIAALPSLRHLCLYASRIRSFEAIEGHPSLESLAFGSGRVRDLAPLASIPNLTTLRFRRVSRFEDEHAEAIGDLAGLESLAIADQPRITDLSMLTRAPAPTLRALELDGLRGLRSATFLDGLPALEDLIVLDSGAAPTVPPGSHPRLPLRPGTVQP